MSDMPATKEAQDAKIAEALQQGYTIVYDDDYTLLLDLDEPQAITTFEFNLSILQQHLEVVIHDRWESKSSTKFYPREHVVLKVGRPMTPTERHLLQAALGSDPKRELLYWIQ